MSDSEKPIDPKSPEGIVKTAEEKQAAAEAAAAPQKLSRDDFEQAEAHIAAEIDEIGKEIDALLVKKREKQATADRIHIEHRRAFPPPTPADEFQRMVGAMNASRGDSAKAQAGVLALLGGRKPVNPVDQPRVQRDPRVLPPTAPAPATK